MFQFVKHTEGNSVKLYLLFVSDQKSIQLYDGIQEKSSRISNDVKEIIKELFELKLKPKAIIEVLDERGMTPPSILG